MKKIISFLFALILFIGSIIGQTPAIIMTTALEVGSTFSFDLRANAENTPIQVDFGDGILLDILVDTNTTNVSNILIGSHNVKVYGSGITHFICSSDELTNLDVRNAEELIYLDCFNNQLAQLDVSHNIALTTLNLEANQLVALDVSNNSALQYLICDNNQLTTLDVSKNSKLLFLDCGANRLISLDVSNNPTLQQLHCACNQITSLDINKDTLLTHLVCFGNGLTTLVRWSNETGQIINQI